ncbi:CHASE3 domain-containing protein [Erythrobacter sp. A6_0]|uniref:sensor histidine kinase n=1 Tax=Erythrobacter sp. A6_0 TaxID=2821089 RepID=UPI001ADD05A1|nr:CHASE3 domain-containing protein [Erythrobacter sp. A6_0]MBO9512169.1 CHASE3 domain-containing protein [Erythrobacter sp. A6_0]
MTPKFDLLGRRNSFKWGNVTLLALMALAMIGLIVVAFQTIESERAEREQVERTNDILLELRNVSSAAVNAETGQRGYLITLDRRYLESYLFGREQIDPSLRRLRTAMEDEETTRRQTELVDQIEALATSKFAEMDESVRLLEDGRLIDARREMLSDQGQETMERLRRAIGEMERIEFQLLSDATEETARAEGRVLPLLGALMLLLIGSIVAGTRLVARTARAEVEAAQAVALGEARDRADLLARELNHRVKNLFAVVLAIIQLSGRDKPESKEVTDGIAERVRALLTAHEVSQGELDRPVASLRALVETTFAPYRSSKLTAEIEGDEILLPAKQVTPLGLVLHELTTNAVKYGAWASGGTIAVDWQRVGDTIKLVWQEQGDAIETEPERRGFGSMLMTSASRQFGGSIEREFLAEGVRVTIELPIEDQQNELPATG